MQKCEQCQHPSLGRITYWHLHDQITPICMDCLHKVYKEVIGEVTTHAELAQLQKEGFALLEAILLRSKML